MTNPPVSRRTFWPAPRWSRLSQVVGIHRYNIAAARNDGAAATTGRLLVFVSFAGRSMRPVRGLYGARRSRLFGMLTRGGSEWVCRCLTGITSAGGAARTASTSLSLERRSIEQVAFPPRPPKVRTWRSAKNSSLSTAHPRCFSHRWQHRPEKQVNSASLITSKWCG